MLIKAYLGVLLVTACSVALGEGNTDLENKMLRDCQVVAKKLNKSKELNRGLDEIQPFVTWHATCAERAPTGPGNVTALCEGKRETAKGKERVFFWEKATHGKFNRGFFICAGQ
jgi:hypothetical protein